MSAAATTRRTGTPPSTFTRPATRSSRVMIRPKAGAGATWTKSSSICPIGPPRRTDQSLATISFDPTPCLPAGPLFGRVRYFAFSSGPQPLVFEALVEAGDEFGVSVEQQRRPPLADPEQRVARLAPARMRHLRIDVRPEAVFGRLQGLPISIRALVRDAETRDRLDGL